MIGKSVTYRDDTGRNLRALVTAVHRDPQQAEPALDLVVVTDTGETFTRERVPHYSHKLEVVTLRTLNNRRKPSGEVEQYEHLQLAHRRQPGEHWRY